MSAIKNLGLIVVLAGLAACGGGASTAPSGVEAQVVRQQVGALQGASITSIQSDRTATVDVAADWAVAGNDVDVYVTPADCINIPSALSAFSCVTVARTDGTAKPERLTFSAVAGSSYKVLVLNRGDLPDMVTVTVTIR